MDSIREPTGRSSALDFLLGFVCRILTIYRLGMSSFGLRHVGRDDFIQASKVSEKRRVHDEPRCL